MAPAKKKSAKKPSATTPAEKAPRLLAGGNPQIAKGDGDAPVQAYVAAIPDWRRDVVAWVDALVERAVPGVRKAVKWNSPMYGAPAPREGYFLGVHLFARYVKVAFFDGVSLDPEPPVGSKDPNVRYVHLGEGEPRDAKQLTAWVKQAAKLPGWRPGAKG